MVNSFFLLGKRDCVVIDDQRGAVSGSRANTRLTRSDDSFVNRMKVFTSPEAPVPKRAILNTSVVNGVA